MKTKERLLLILFCFLVYSKSFSQFNEQLCRENENIVFAFQLKNQKWVSVCEEKNEKYLVYRFGENNKPELEYPSVLDSSSWQKFIFKGYERGGGKQNAAMYFGYLNFINNDVQYEIYQTWDSEDDREYCGVSIVINKRNIEMPGIVKSKKGSLLSLLRNGKIKIVQEGD